MLNKGINYNCGDGNDSFGCGTNEPGLLSQTAQILAINFQPLLTYY